MNWIDSFLDWTKDIEPPQVFLEAVAISMIAAAAERKVWFDQGVGMIYCNNYIVLVGPPASRKSTAALKGLQILQQLKSIAIAPDEITKEAMYIDIEEQAKKFHYIDQDVIHSSYTVISTEWENFIQEKDNKFLTSLIKLYDCERMFRYYTKHQGKNIILNVFFNMLGCIQPSKLGTVLPLSAIGSGFTSRIIFVVGDKPRKLNPLPMLSPKTERLLVMGLRAINGAIGGMRFSNEAWDLYSEWYREKQKENHLLEHEKFISYVHRKPQHIIKIAMCMCLSRTLGEDLAISLEDLERAFNWLGKVEQTMTNAYGAFGLSPHAELINSIKGFIKKSKTTTDQEILRMFEFDVSLVELSDILARFRKMGIVKTIPRNGGIVGITYLNEGGQRE